MYWSCTIAVFSMFLPLTRCSFHIELYMRSYLVNNQDMAATNCDVFTNCDPMFTFCLDATSGSESMSSCRYKSLTTDAYTDKNSISFSTSFRGRGDNPLVVSVTESYQGLKFKVRVRDADDNGDDEMDTFRFMYTSRPARTSSDANWQSFALSGQRSNSPSQLEFDLKTYCNPDFYGYGCDVYCVARDTDSQGHYTCNQNTGEKECRAGWESVEDDCRVRIDNCESHQCTNGAFCMDEFNSYWCFCMLGYTGQYCEVNIDECQSMPCSNGGSCIDGVYSYRCDCDNLEHYTGPHCELHTCDVITDYCTNGATCANINGLPMCQCQDYYHGDFCELHSCDLMAPPYCKNKANCTHNGNQPTCVCAEYFTGEFCETHFCDTADYCNGHGECNRDNVTGSPTCQCQDFYSGSQCEEFICEADPNYCMNNGTCNNYEGSPNCTCAEYYSGPQCEYFTCDNDLEYCQNEGTCYKDGNIPKCNCTQYFSGATCQIFVCESTPEYCNNGGFCYQNNSKPMCDCQEYYSGALCEFHRCDVTPEYCHNIGVCQNINGVPVCDCPQYFSGQQCETFICDYLPYYCSNNATCYKNNASQPQCECQDFYSGTFCENHICDVVSDYCMNGGFCYNVNGSPECQCAEYYSGSLCQLFVCDIDLGYCSNHGDCVNIDGQPKCQCDDYYYGDHCQQHRCQIQPEYCENNGSCVNEDDTPICHCTDHYTGSHCENHTCVTDPHYCLSEGTCLEVGGQPVCLCTELYTGLRCESHVCQVLGCANNGACINGTCVCDGNFRGPLCDIDMCEGVTCDVNHYCVGGACVDWTTTPESSDIQNQPHSGSNDVSVTVMKDWMITVIAACALLVLGVIVALFVIRWRHTHGKTSTLASDNSVRNPAYSISKRPPARLPSYTATNENFYHDAELKSPTLSEFNAEPIYTEVGPEVEYDNNMPDVFNDGYLEPKQTQLMTSEPEFAPAAYDNSKQVSRSISNNLDPVTPNKYLHLTNRTPSESNPYSIATSPMPKYDYAYTFTFPPPPPKPVTDGDNQILSPQNFNIYQHNIDETKHKEPIPDKTQEEQVVKEKQCILNNQDTTCHIVVAPSNNPDVQVKNIKAVKDEHEQSSSDDNKLITKTPDDVNKTEMNKPSYENVTTPQYDSPEVVTNDPNGTSQNFDEKSVDKAVTREPIDSDSNCFGFPEFLSLSEEYESSSDNGHTPSEDISIGLNQKAPTYAKVNKVASTSNPINMALCNSDNDEDVFDDDPMYKYGADQLYTQHRGRIIRMESTNL